MTTPNFIFEATELNDLQILVSVRDGEDKLGQSMTVAGNRTGAEKYLLLGINEDLGPQANGGRPGCTKAFAAFMSRFVNMQSNRFLQGNGIFVLGQIHARTSFDQVNPQTVISELDALVCEILEPYVQEGIIPIVIGGGHNNAYPLIKVQQLCRQRKIAAVNCDPHADFRKRDFRHSGNPFSYAFYDGFLSQYCVLGLHQSYNNQFMLEELSNNNFFHSFYDHYLLDPEQFQTDLRTVKNRLHDECYGLELDMDAIAYMPSSALSPSGISVETARKYISEMACTNCVYLHLPEAAPQNESEMLLVGKTLAYLVSDFVKNQQKEGRKD